MCHDPDSRPNYNDKDHIDRLIRSIEQDPAVKDIQRNTPSGNRPSPFECEDVTGPFDPRCNAPDYEDEESLPYHYRSHHPSLTTYTRHHPKGAR